MQRASISMPLQHPPLVVVLRNTYAPSAMGLGGYVLYLGQAQT